MFKEYLEKIAAFFLVTLLSPCVSAQEITAIPARVTIPDGTLVSLRISQNVSSARARVGDRLNVVVVRDVSVAGFTVIPAGAAARGSHTGVKGRRLMGIGGRVTLKLDSVELINGDRVGLRASREVEGGSRTTLMVAGMIVTGLIFLPAMPDFLLTPGHESAIVKSTELTARIDGATSILSAGLPPSRESSSELGAMMGYLPPKVFSVEGREGDMVNLVFVAEQEGLQEAFDRGGWVKTDKWSPSFVWHLARHGTKDTKLPMARFYVFGRVQDYSYALPDPDVAVSRRHHLRIWKTRYTVDGTPIWAAAATHDITIEIAKRGRLINHRIDPEVDAERDFIESNLTEVSAVSRQEYLFGTDPVLQAQTASGETYHSDGRILLLDLRQRISTQPPLSVQSTDIESGGS